MRQKGNIWSFDSRDLMRSKCSHCTTLAVARELGVSGLAELLNQFTSKPESLAITYGIRFEEELENSLLEALGDQGDVDLLGLDGRAEAGQGHRGGQGQKFALADHGCLLWSGCLGEEGRAACRTPDT